MNRIFSDLDTSKDYLREDAPIDGQRFVCLSFAHVPLSREEEFHCFCFQSFQKEYFAEVRALLESPPPDVDPTVVLKDVFEKMENIRSTYQDYKYAHGDAWKEAFNKLHENTPWQTSGVKVRGVTRTLEEANDLAEALKKKDSYHHIFLGQVGYWMDARPDPLKVKEQKYSHDQLNLLVGGLEENKRKTDQFFEEMKERKLEEARKAKDSSVEEVAEKLEQADPFLQKKERDEEERIVPASLHEA